MYASDTCNDDYNFALSSEDLWSVVAMKLNDIATTNFAMQPAYKPCTIVYLVSPYMDYLTFTMDICKKPEN